MKLKTIYWITTTIIFLFEGVMPALTGWTQLAIDGIRHLGYPDYFRVALNIFKITGTIALILPMVPRRLKEWAYAGFTFNFIFAGISHAVVDGFGIGVIMPAIILAIHLTSYFTWHKLNEQKQLQHA